MKNQHGFMLLVVLLPLFLLGLGAVMADLRDWRNHEQQQQSALLQQAKAAALHYLIGGMTKSEASPPGDPIRPDTLRGAGLFEGEPDSIIGSIDESCPPTPAINFCIGALPWRPLSLPPPSANRMLWYATSRALFNYNSPNLSRLKNHIEQQRLLSVIDRNGRHYQHLVSVFILAGTALPQQQRPTFPAAQTLLPDIARHYLESLPAANLGPLPVLTSGEKNYRSHPLRFTNASNDQWIAIDVNELATAMASRISHEWAWHWLRFEIQRKSNRPNCLEPVDNTTPSSLWPTDIAAFKQAAERWAEFCYPYDHKRPWLSKWVDEVANIEPNGPQLTLQFHHCPQLKFRWRWVAAAGASAAHIEHQIESVNGAGQCQLVNVVSP